MSHSTINAELASVELQSRIQRFYQLMNERKWQDCFSLVDPRLRSAGKTTDECYASSLSSFFQKYGPVEVLSVDEIKLYIDVPTNKHDDRDFAYGVVAWRDRNNGLHRTQERWVKADDGMWYSRMVGRV